MADSGEMSAATAFVDAAHPKSARMRWQFQRAGIVCPLLAAVNGRTAGKEAYLGNTVGWRGGLSRH